MFDSLQKMFDWLLFGLTYFEQMLFDCAVDVASAAMRNIPATRLKLVIFLMLFIEVKNAI